MKTATLIKPDGIEQIDIPAGKDILSWLQEQVGGYVEHVHKDAEGNDYLLNEDGIRLGLPFNTEATQRLMGKVNIAGAIRGNLLIMPKGTMR